jgi:pyruvate,water dikinase
LWIREDRALWQLRAVGAVREAFLRRGEVLVVAGMLDQADDVMFLLPDEFDGRSPIDRDAIAARRAEHVRWLPVVPPAVVGGKPEAPIGEGGALRGVPVSAGVAEGPARVITDLAHADRLNAGDVLVCTMTAPPWTPLLSVAAALVTDAGDVMSHASIAAREYGLPCVVGTGTATVRIHDGDLVRVDGDAGIVEVLGG